MTIENIRTVAVLGAGTMGNGIAHVFARFGFQVILRDVEGAVLSRAQNTIAKNLDREEKKGKIAEGEKSKILARIQSTTDMSEIVRADFAVEAVPERLDLKLSVLRDADKLLRPGVILASNTSSISVTTLAAATSRPDRFIGMHFMNPVPVMQLVELIRGIATADDTFEAVHELTLRLNKTPAPAEDFPAFIVNRILLPMINEAVYTLYEGVGSVEAIDTAMKLGAHHPMGPLELADFIGLDTCLSVMQVLYEGLADSKYRPCPLLVKYVEAGWLGRKTQRGFYDYRGEKPVPTR
jgi:3-hydroxybutyryl-CoA dehydrogenase